MAASFLSQAVKKLQAHKGPNVKRKTQDLKWNADFERLLAGNRTKAERRNSSVVTPIAGFLDHVEIESAIDGQFDVLTGDDAGWAKLHLSWRCLAWRVRVWSHEVDRLDTSNWFASDYAAALLGALVFGDEGFTAWCTDWVNGFLRREKLEPGRISTWHRPVHWYILQLAYLKLQKPWDREPLVFDDFEKVRFDGLLETLIETPIFAELINKLCLTHADEVSHSERFIPNVIIVVFQWYFPAEILALLAIRGGNNLLDDPNRHPLLATPLAKLPSSIPRIVNTYLDRAIPFFRQHIPELAKFNP